MIRLTLIVFLLCRPLLFQCERYETRVGSVYHLTNIHFEEWKTYLYEIVSNHTQLRICESNGETFRQVNHQKTTDLSISLRDTSAQDLLSFKLQSVKVNTADECVEFKIFYDSLSGASKYSAEGTLESEEIDIKSNQTITFKLKKVSITLSMEIRQNKSIGILHSPKVRQMDVDYSALPNSLPSRHYLKEFQSNLFKRVVERDCVHPTLSQIFDDLGRTVSLNFPFNMEEQIKLFTKRLIKAMTLHVRRYSHISKHEKFQFYLDSIDNCRNIEMDTVPQCHDTLHHVPESFTLHRPNYRKFDWMLEGNFLIGPVTFNGVVKDGDEETRLMVSIESIPLSIIFELKNLYLKMISLQKREITKKIELTYNKATLSEECAMQLIHRLLLVKFPQSVRECIQTSINDSPLKDWVEAVSKALTIKQIQSVVDDIDDFLIRNS